MRPGYDAIVIGSGFGGSVAACRLAQAGLKVGVIERGRSYENEPFPRDWDRPGRGLVWQADRGLFDIRPFRHMTAVQAAGLGGGSLVYSSIQMRAPEWAFEQEWPRGFSRAALNPYYDLAAYMLDIKPITQSNHLGIPPKARMMEKAARSLGRAEQFCYPNLALDFGPPGEAHRNKFGVEQKGCTYCGECTLGCNEHAKNTLDLNYLAVARQHGADITANCEVTRIEQFNDGYRVRFKDHAGGDTPGESTARYVFVCGGAVNSTELMLRCRDVYRTLPNLSRRLGDGYSANGDFQAMAFHTEEPFKSTEGPIIATAVIHSRHEAGFDNWFMLQEGGCAREVAKALQIADPRRGLLFGGADLVRAWYRRRTGKDEIPDPGIDRFVLLLMMGRDLAAGAMRLNRRGNMTIDWDTVANRPLYDAEMRFANDFAHALGADDAHDPLWQKFRVRGSVHNLGGCLMADSPEAGVTDPTGEVYGYPGLFVLDSAILPKSTGVNPAHTITAVAERNIEATIRRITLNEGWRAPEAASAQPIIEPLSQLTIPEGGTAPMTTQPVGITFTETMRGHLVRGWAPHDDFRGAEREGKAASSIVEFTVTISMPNLSAALASEEHPGIMSGTVRVDGFTPKGGSPVIDGVFNLFVKGAPPNGRHMIYMLPFIGADGKPYLLDGYKDVRDHGRFDVWGAATTLYTVIREGHSRDGAVAATGIVRFHLSDLPAMMASFKVTGMGRPMERIGALARFGGFSAAQIAEVFIPPLE
ncbi:MAG TPA: GMC family oxidoreductase [Candidatus Binataceae bacterium]|nr:GMC family oxidoreductase [Candidatus Binataceae bacterium]